MESYRALMRSNPLLASTFVHDLIAWQRWDFVDEYQRVKLDLGADDPLGKYAVELYLHSASAHGVDSASRSQ